MRLAAETATNTNTTRSDRLVAGFAALAVSVHILESAIPMPLPGVKPGLANVIVLIVMLRYGWRMGFAVSLLRVIVGSMFVGTFLTPTFFLSLAGALASVIIGGTLIALSRQWTGPVGIAIAMAMAHMSAQFLLAWWLFVPHPALFNLLPILLAASIGLGAFSGIIAHNILQRLPARNT